VKKNRVFLHVEGRWSMGWNLYSLACNASLLCSLYITHKRIKLTTVKAHFWLDIHHVNGLRTSVIPEADFQVLISSSEFPVLNHKDKPSTMIKPFNEMTRIGNKMAMCNIKLFSLLIWRRLAKSFFHWKLI